MNNLYVFVTLTLDRELWPEADKAWDEIWHLWLKLRKRLRRAYPKSNFLAVLEKHPESEYPHIHFATDTFIPVDRKHCRGKQRPLTDLWRECGGGTIVYAKWIEGGAAEYMGKQNRISQYTTKDLCGIGDHVKPRRRVWNCSRGLKRPSKVSNKDVKFLRRYHVWNEKGERHLTDEEINRILDDVTYNTIAKEYYGEKRQIGSNLETTFRQVPAERLEKCFTLLASDGRQQKGHAASKAAKSAKVEAQCANQETERLDSNIYNQLTFDWSEP